MEVEVRTPILRFLFFNTANSRCLYYFNPLSRIWIMHSSRESIRIHIGRSISKGLVWHERISNSKLRIVIVWHALWVRNNEPTRTNISQGLANNSRWNNWISRIHHNQSCVSSISHQSSISLIDNNIVVPLSLQMFQSGTHMSLEKSQSLPCCSVCCSKSDIILFLLDLVKYW